MRTSKNTFIENFKKVVLILVLILFVSCNSDSDDTSSGNNDDTTDMTEDTSDTNDDSDNTDNTDDSQNTDYDITPILSMFDDVEAISYSVNGGSVTITTDNLPNHKSPYYKDTQWHESLYQDYNGTNSQFHLNPNRIGSQNVTFTITLNPAEATNKSATPLGPIGISRNGVVFFNQYAAGNSALDNEINSFDQYLGHPSGNSMYHYHIEPTYLTEVYGDDALLGLLADGFPVYGPVENGETLTSSDLDDYHGHFGVTADFPNGIYHYHITADAPYLNGDGYFGTKGNIAQ